jgi:hypothetical protein
MPARGRIHAGRTPFRSGRRAVLTAGRRGAVPTTLSALLFSLILGVSPVLAADPSIPPEVDPGTPTYVGLGDPVPDEPVTFDPAINMLQAIHDADVAAGGGSFWIDRILERPAGGSEKL